MDRRERGREFGRELDVVEADDRELLRDLHALGRAFDERTEGDEVVAARERREGLAAVALPERAPFWTNSPAEGMSLAACVAKPCDPYSPSEGARPSGEKINQ